MAAHACRANKVILAPMVRIGTLPTRLLCLRYGADLVYSEELIDFKLDQCRRVRNRILDTVDFICSRGRCIFRTCKEEKGRVVLQIGTSNAQRALRVAKLLENDVAGIDINMGCPKDFSIKGGMGAALLRDPDTVQTILTTLVKNLSIPVSCKIRLLPDRNETLRLVKMIEACGVVAIAVHGRYQTERSESPVHADAIAEISQSVSIPVIANGGSNHFACLEDILEFQKSTKCASVMVARAAQWNPSVFRKEGVLPVEVVVKDYLKLAVDYDNHGGNTKYCLAQLMHKDMTSKHGRELLRCRSFEEMCRVWGLEGYLEHAVLKRKGMMDMLTMNELKDLNLQEVITSSSKKMKLEPEVTEDGVQELYVVFDRHASSEPNLTPKSKLYEWARQFNKLKPTYATIQRSKDRMFKSVVTVNDMQFSSSHWEKNKKWSEQSAAIVAIIILDIEDTSIASVAMT